MLGNNSSSENSNSYAEKYAISFRRGAKDDSPFFAVDKYFPNKEKLDSVNKVSGTFKGVLFNNEKDVTTRDGRSVTISASFSIVIEDVNSEGETIVYYVQIDYGCGSQMRATLNSILSAEVGDSLELFTKFSVGKDGKKYKVINVSNPDEKKEISYKDKKTGEDKKATVNVSYPWAYGMDVIPKIEVVRDGDEILKVKDEKANEFFKDAIADKFSTKEETKDTSADISVSDIPF